MMSLHGNTAGAGTRSWYRCGRLSVKGELSHVTSPLWTYTVLHQFLFNYELIYRIKIYPVGSKVARSTLVVPQHFGGV